MTQPTQSNFERGGPSGQLAGQPAPEEDVPRSLIAADVERRLGLTGSEAEPAIHFELWRRAHRVPPYDQERP